MKIQSRIRWAALPLGCCVLLAPPAAAFIQTATNGILSVKMDDNPNAAGKIGLFMVGTGAQHPDPGKAIFYSYGNDASLGTSWITVKDDATMTLWTNAPQGFEPPGGAAGYSIASMRTPAATQTGSASGFRTVYPVAGLTITQDVVIVGSTLYNSCVRHTVTVRNDGGTAKTIGVRILWDWMVASIDASVFKEREPDGLFTRSFTGFADPSFRRYQVSDSDVLPTFNIFGTTHGGSLADAPTQPDELRYASWSDASLAAWDFPVAGSGSDSAIVYYWGLTTPVTLAPGESRSFTEYVTTNLDAFRRALPMVRTTGSNTLLVCSGERIDYTISFSNAGDGTALDLTINDTISPLAQFVPGSLTFWAQSDDLGTPALVSSAYGTGLFGPWTAGDPPGVIGGNPHLLWQVDRLAPGKSAVIRYAVTVANGADPNTGMFTSASATSLWDDGYFRGTGTLVTVQGAILEKRSNPIEVMAGETVRYTLMLLSPCDATLYNLSVWDSVPAGADAIIPLTLGGTISGTQMVYWTVPQLGPKQSAYLEYEVRMNGTKSPVYNRGIAAYDAYRLGSIEPQERIASLMNSTDVRLPKLDFKKVFDPDGQSPADPNGLVNFGIEVRNEFKMTLTNVVIWDSLPMEMTFDAASGASYTFPQPQMVLFDLGTVWAGQSRAVDLRVRLSAGCDDLFNEAMVNFDTLPAPMPYPPRGTGKLRVELNRPLLSINTTPANSPVPAGSLLTWNLTPLNSGKVDAGSVQVWDSVPARTVFDSCGGAPCTILPVTSSATIVQWTLGTLQAQTTWMVWFSVWIDTIPADIGPDAPSVRFTIGGGCQTLTVTSYESVANIAYPDLEILKYPADVVVPIGGGVSYTLRVANHGTDTSYDTTIVDSVPAGLDIAGCGGWDGWSCTVTGGMVVWTLPTLPPDATTEITFTATVTGPTPICDPHPEAPAIGGAGNNWPIGFYKSRAGIDQFVPWNMNTSCVTAGDAILSMSSLIAYSAPPHGATQTFQFTVSSTGGLPAQNVVVWDTLPSGMGRITCAGGVSCTTIGDLVTWTLPVMPPGQSVILEATATVYEGIGCTSYAEASYDNPLGLPRARLSSTPICFPVLRPEIVLSVRPQRLIYAAGEAVTFVISWTNIGTKETDKDKIWNFWMAGPNWSTPGTGYSAGPAGLNAIPYSVINGTIFWDSVGPVAGETGIATVTCYPALSTTNCELATIDARVVYEYGYGSPLRASAEAFANPKPTITSSSLALTLTVTAGTAPVGTVPGGEPVTYRITMSNVCFQTFFNLVVWETVPAGAAYTGCTAPPGATCGPVAGPAGTIVRWNVPVFWGWSVTGMTFSASITGDPGTCAAGGELVGPSRAMATGNNTVGLAQPVAYSNRATVALLLPCLVVDKNAPPEGESALPVVFTLDVRNAGDDTAYAVVVTDTLPAPLKYVSSMPPAAVAGAVVSWSLTLAPGAGFQASVTAVVPDANLDYTLLNTAVARYLTATGARRPDRSDQASVRLSAKLGLTVSPSPYDPSRGRLRFSGIRDGSRVMIYSLSGVEIVALSGVARHQLGWDGRNRSGEPVAAGIYLYAVEQPDGRGGVTWTRGKFGLIR